MNVTQMYDAVEGEGKAEPRPLRLDDVLKHNAGDYYLIFTHKGLLVLGNLREGTHYDNVRVANSMQLTREEASSLCGGNPTCFRLIGRAKDVVVIKDPGE